MSDLAEIRTSDQQLHGSSDWESPLVRVFGGPPPGHEPACTAQLQAAARVLEASVPAAARLGIAIGVETHDTFCDSSVLAELLALAASPWVGAVWEEAEVALPQHLRLLESWLRDPQEAV